MSFGNSTLLTGQWTFVSWQRHACVCMSITDYSNQPENTKHAISISINASNKPCWALIVFKNFSLHIYACVLAHTVIFLKDIWYHVQWTLLETVTEQRKNFIDLNHAVLITHNVLTTVTSFEAKTWLQCFMFTKQAKLSNISLHKKFDAKPAIHIIVKGFSFTCCFTSETTNQVSSSNTR